MKKSQLFAAFILVTAMVLTGCMTPNSASQKANLIADQKMYTPISYPNAHKKGPLLVVLPGNIKSANAGFRQKVTANNIADYAELELAKANFRVLERSDLGYLLNEVALAANLGDLHTLKKFRRGRFKATKWFLRFDILKAEPVARASTGFNAGPLLAIGGALLGGNEGRAVGTAGRSIQTEETAKVWIVGLRYKILDATTTEQMSTGYFEEKMEMGAKSTAILGVSQSQGELVTLDTMVQRLVQRAVMEIDTQK